MLNQFPPRRRAAILALICFSAGLQTIYPVLVVVGMKKQAVAKYGLLAKCPQLPFSPDFIGVVKNGNVKNIKVANDGIGVRGTYTNGGCFATHKPSDYRELYVLLEAHGVAYDIAPPPAWWVEFLKTWGPMIPIAAVLVVMLLQQAGGSSRSLRFGKSHAKRFQPDRQTKTTFAQVGGAREAAEEVRDVIEFLREPKKFQRVGGRIPKGVLLMGEPGTGTTLLARAIAGEANVPFFSIAGSDFVEMLVGVGAGRVRDLFDDGKKHAPCIIFIDEIDAVGRYRDANNVAIRHDEREQTLNQLLVEMDGFDSSAGVILIAATNRQDMLDPALLRPGRFDRRVVVPKPDVRGREEILKIHTKNIPLAGDADLAIIARGTPGFSGADLANLANESALHAGKENRAMVTAADFDLAKDKALMGVERRSMVMSGEEKKNTAYHEAGHALIAALSPHADPLHKVTIIPRGVALGLTAQLPLDDKHTYSRAYLETRLKILMGGRVAEKLFLDTITTGATNDIEEATLIARRMVCEWGMTDDVGMLALGKMDGANFYWRGGKPGAEIEVRADSATRALIDTAYAQAETLLQKHGYALVRIAEALMEQETLTGEEVRVLICQ